MMIVMAAVSAYRAVILVRCVNLSSLTVIELSAALKNQ